MSTKPTAPDCRVVALDSGASATHPSHAGAPSDGFGGVTGTVSDASTGRAINTATIELIGSRGVTGSSSETGGFVLDSIPSGRYTVVVRRIGFEPARGAITVRIGAWLTVEAKLIQVVCSSHGNE